MQIRFIGLLFVFFLCDLSAMTKVSTPRCRFKFESQNDIRAKIKTLKSPVSVISIIFDQSTKLDTKLRYLVDREKEVINNLTQSASISDMGKTLHYSDYLEFILKLRNLLKFYLSVPVITLDMIQRSCSNDSLRQTVIKNIKHWTDGQIEIIEMLSLWDKEYAGEYLHVALGNVTKALNVLSEEIKPLNIYENTDLCAKIVTMHIEIKHKFKESIIALNKKIYMVEMKQRKFSVL
jgi:hypothetical protein